MKKLLWVLLILLLIILVYWVCNQTKTSNPAAWQTYIKTDSNYQHIPGDSTQQIIVFRTDSSGNYFSYWLDSIKKATKNNDIQITLFCGTCDSTLMLLTGAGIKTFIQGSGGGKGGGGTCTNPPNPNCSGGGPGGGGDTIYWCVNFPVEFKDSIDFDTSTYLQEKKIRSHLVTSASATASVNDNEAITVAVFDTGIDTLDLKNYLYVSTSDACLSPMANNGWNFPDHTDNVWDNYHPPVGHGKTVARLIVDQVNHYNRNNVKILPVKIHDSHGQSDLFSVLCGFSYAVNRGAKIINASFGYYALKNPSSTTTVDPGALLLKAYIKQYLTQNNILLIAAAGNADLADADASIKDLYIKVGLPVPTDLRNLDNVNFYPASLAADPELQNIIAVTTASKDDNTTSPNENYSKNVVDIGVNGNVSLDGDYWFTDPLITNCYVRGSSYATPVVSGIACAFYNDIKADLGNKDKILTTLLREPSVGEFNTVNNRVKKGIVFDRAH